MRSGDAMTCMKKSGAIAKISEQEKIKITVHYPRNIIQGGCVAMKET